MKESWKIKKLGDVCQVIGGGTPPKDRADFYGGSIPWATVRDMRQDIIAETEFSITRSAVNACATNVIPANNVVIATRVGLGKVCFIEKDTAINQDLRGIVPINKKELSVRFLFWWFKSVANLIEQEGTGATVQGVKLPFIKSLSIPIPPLAEQNCIADLLDDASERIGAAASNAERNLSNSRELFESYLNSVYSQKGAGWIERPLGEIVEIKHGFAFKSEYFRNEGRYVLLTPGNFYEEGGYRDRGGKQKFYVGEIPDGYILKKNDFLFAMTEQAAGLLGSSIIVPENDKFLHNQRLGLVSVKAGVPWCNKFFFHQFNTKKFRREVHSGASGLKVRHTSPNKLGIVNVCYPKSVLVQEQIAAKLDEISFEANRLENIYKRKLDYLAKLKHSVLHKALAGGLTGLARQISQKAVA